MLTPAMLSCFIVSIGAVSAALSSVRSMGSVRDIDDGDEAGTNPIESDVWDKTGTTPFMLSSSVRSLVRPLLFIAMKVSLSITSSCGTSYRLERMRHSLSSIMDTVIRIEKPNSR